MTHKKDLKKLDRKLDRLKEGDERDRKRYRGIERLLRKLAR